MPRHSRTKSESGIYHIMLRGINRQNIFEEDEDYVKFIDTLKRYQKISNYRIYAYCLMTNHIHFLMKVEEEEPDLIIKRIAGSYVYWYNWKYYRVGHLFQDRFKSEPVEDNEYLLTVLRYIHQNPVKANMVKNISDYKYSSYNDYIAEDNSLTSIEYALTIMNKEQFIDFNAKENDDECLEYKVESKPNDTDARVIIRKVSGCETIAEFQSLLEGDRNKYICILRENGLSMRQICRLTGERFSKVRKF